MKDVDILPGDMIQPMLGTCWLVVSVRQRSKSFGVFVLTPDGVNHHVVLKSTRCRVHDDCYNYTLLLSSIDVEFLHRQMCRT